jgi:hypothetical protein
MEKMELGMLCSQLREIMQSFLLAAVVNQNDVGKTVLQQTVDDGNQLLIRVKGGQDNRDFG